MDYIHFVSTSVTVVIESIDIYETLYRKVPTSFPAGTKQGWESTVYIAGAGCISYVSQIQCAVKNIQAA